MAGTREDLGTRRGEEEGLARGHTALASREGGGDLKGHKKGGNAGRRNAGAEAGRTQVPQLASPCAAGDARRTSLPGKEQPGTKCLQRRHGRHRGQPPNRRSERRCDVRALPIPSLGKRLPVYCITNPLLLRAFARLVFGWFSELSQLKGERSCQR